MTWKTQWVSKQEFLDLVEQIPVSMMDAAQTYADYYGVSVNTAFNRLHSAKRTKARNKRGEEYTLSKVRREEYDRWAHLIEIGGGDGADSRKR